MGLIAHVKETSKHRHSGSSLHLPLPLTRSRPSVAVGLRACRRGLEYGLLLPPGVYSLSSTFSSSTSLHDMSSPLRAHPCADRFEWRSLMLYIPAPRPCPAKRRTRPRLHLWSLCIMWASSIWTPLGKLASTGYVTAPWIGKLGRRCWGAAQIWTGNMNSRRTKSLDVVVPVVRNMLLDSYMPIVCLPVRQKL